MQDDTQGSADLQPSSDNNEDTKVDLSILERAQELIHGDRQKEYGPPKANLEGIGDMWTAYINVNQPEVEIELNGQDVCAMMIMVKLARMAGDYHHDGVTDVAGYAGLMELIQ